MFDRATRALGAALERAAGEPITYRRGGLSRQLTAVRGRSEFQTATPHGLPVVVYTTDWVFAAAGLILGGTITEPEAGDVIEIGDTRWEVRHPDGHRPYGYSDHGRTRLRVHTQQRPDA